MSTHTTNARESQLWWSPSELQEMLSMITPDGVPPPPVASSSKSSLDDAENGFHAVASQAASLPQTPVSDHDNLLQYWRPCTGEQTIGSWLDAFQFPVSFRDLVYRWEEAGSPHLRSLRVPLGVRTQINAATFESHAPLDLHTITEMQERAVIVAVDDYFRRGCFAPQNHLFVTFASYLDIYTSLHVELMALQEGWGIEHQNSAYQSTYLSLLDAFDRDRSKCATHEAHDCLHLLLWGEVSAWPSAEIRRCFEAYRMRSPTTQSRPATSMPASPLSSRQGRATSQRAWSEGLDMSQTPYLSSGSSSCDSSSESVKPVGLSPSLDEPVSPWAHDLTHSSSLNTLPTSVYCNDASPISLVSDIKQWSDLSLAPQALQDVPSAVGSFAISNSAVRRCHSRSSSYPSPMQLSRSHTGLSPSQSDGSLNVSASSSPRMDNAAMHTAQHTRDLQIPQSRSSAADLVAKDSWTVDPEAVWMQQQQSLLHEAAAQLELAAQLLSAKASRLRCCSADQEQWHSSLEHMSRPAMRRHHTNQ